MRAAVIINQRARRVRHDSDFSARLRREFSEAGVEAFVRFCPFRGISDLLPTESRSTPPDVLVAVGGDGTTSSVAAACLEAKIPLGVIPAGTHNHFARDLGLSLETREAVRSIAQGKVTNVDVGEVNGRIFINNSSVGAYPRAVEERDELIERFGFRKSIAQILATLRVFARRPTLRAEIELDGRLERCATPFVFVGNNAYQLKPLNERFRDTLQGGQLCLFTSEPAGVGGLLRLFWLSLLNRLNQATDFHSRLAQQVTIRLPRRFVRVSKDGEVLRLESPLRYSIRPKVLPVFIP